MTFSAGGATIQADTANNALIIAGPEPVYNNLRAIIEKLDVRRAQVYVEALIVEVETAWPDEYDDWEPAERARVERLLHQSPEQASQLEYVRTHTGFCRRIVVTPEDLARVGA